MELTYESLSKYIRQIDEVNNDLITTTVLGVNIDKYFMPSVANVIGTDLSKYKLLRKGRFACNPMHVGRDKRLPVALYSDDTVSLVSSAYFTFEVTDEHIIDPDYLMLFFRLSQFDRICWFRTDASVRGGITWEDLCDLCIPVPTIAEQRKIVRIYRVITDRIELLQKINRNLLNIAQAIYKNWFVDFEPWGGNLPSSWTCGRFGDFVEVKRGGSPRPIQDFISDSGYRWLKISDVTSVKSPFILSIKEYIKKEGLKKTVLLKPGALVLSNSATPGIPKILDVETCIHDGWLYFPKKQLSNEFLYLFFIDNHDGLVSLGNGSVFTNLKTDILKGFPIAIPDQEVLQQFDSLVQPCFTQMRELARENQRLATLRDALLPRLMSGELDVSTLEI